jgi:hypothetical protein
MYAKYEYLNSLLVERLIKNFINMQASYFKLATYPIKYEPVRCLFAVGCPVPRENVHSSL